MKAIMISDKPKWCALMMNGDKTIEVRKNKALASAIQKLIDEYGYAEIYVYCSKDDKNGLYFVNEYVCLNQKGCVPSDKNGKVVFKFRCYKVEEIEDVYSQENEFGGLCESYGTKTLKTNSLLNKAQLDYLELADYLNDYTPFGYAIHISDLEIFDKPKELSEFETTKQHLVGVIGQAQPIIQNIRLTKAPQNMVYIEVEESTHK